MRSVTKTKTETETVSMGGCCACSAKLDMILAQLARIETREIRMTNTINDVKELVKAVDTHTNEVGAVVAQLRDRLNADPTPQDIEEIAAALTAVSDHLVSIGKDPAAPLPPVPVVPPPA